MLVATSNGLGSAKAVVKVEELRSKLQQIITAGSIRDNVSYTFAVLGNFNDGEPIAVADGWNDRVTGTKITNESLIPAGSVTKTFTVVAAMRMSEQGRLDLDAPVVEFVDPWLRAQNLPTLTDIFGLGNDTNGSILQVTSRMLLSMQSGVPDYDDLKRQQWQIDHPNTDILPHEWVNDANHTLNFKPGTEVEYCSNGYVIMGYLLAAISDAPTWEQLDQLKVIGNPPRNDTAIPFNHTIFMKRGLCSEHSNVVHQYGIKPETSRRVQGSETPKGWTPDDFYDLYNISCLNGWTMGNIATAPQDIVRLYELLGNNKLLTKDTLKSMMDWKNFTQGWPEGAGLLTYGIGLMNPTIAVHDVEGNVASQLQHWGHAGADWGSRMGMSTGYYPALNVSMTFASNAASEMNFTSPSQMGPGFLNQTPIICQLQDALLEYIAPQYPRLVCEQT